MTLIDTVIDVAKETARRGRPFVKKDISGLYGRRVEKSDLIILHRSATDPADRSRNPRVRCLCHCGKEFTTRLSGALFGHCKSCGCRKAKLFTSFWDRQAEKLPYKTIRKIARRMLRGQWSSAVAWALKIDRRICEGAFRMYTSRLIKRFGARIATDERTDHTDFGIQKREFAYISRRVRKHVSEGFELTLQEALELWPHWSFVTQLSVAA